MQKARAVVWQHAQRALAPVTKCTLKSASGSSLGPSHPASSTRTSASQSLPHLLQQCRSFSTDGGSPPDAPPKEGEKLPRRKKLRRRERFGTYDRGFEDELDMVPLEESITHLYNARGIVDKWLGHPTLDGIFPDSDIYGKGEAPKGEPPGEGPILRWQTRVVLGPGGDGWHPANRKVKLSVYLKELLLTPEARERMLLLVGKRYNPNNDELTIVMERNEHREENRKDALRTMYALIEEANKANQPLHEELAV